MSEVTAKSYSLRTEDGQWLGQVVLTSDGMFSSVTDYGNLSYAWRSYRDGQFEEFILGLNIEYFGSKLQNGLSYIAHSNKTRSACLRFAEKILPALKIEIMKQRDNLCQE